MPSIAEFLEDNVMSVNADEIVYVCIEVPYEDPHRFRRLNYFPVYYAVEAHQLEWSLEKQLEDSRSWKTEERCTNRVVYVRSKGCKQVELAGKLLVYFIENERLPPLEATNKQEDQEYQSLLIDAWIMGQECDAPKFQNEVMSALLERGSNHSTPSNSIEQAIYSGYYPLNKFAAEQLVLSCTRFREQKSIVLGAYKAEAWGDIGPAMDQYLLDNSIWDDRTAEGKKESYMVDEDAMETDMESDRGQETPGERGSDGSQSH